MRRHKSHFCAFKAKAFKNSLFLTALLTGLFWLCAPVLAASFYSSGLCDDQNTTRVVGKVSNSLTLAVIPNAVVAIGDQHTLTNDDGVFIFRELPRGVFKLLVSREGYSEHLDTLTLGSPEERIDIRLDPESMDLTAVCRVYDADSGKIIPGAWVTVGTMSGVTDGRGYVRIERIQLTDANRVTAGAYGYLTYSRPLTLEKGTMSLEIYLEKPGTGKGEEILRPGLRPGDRSGEDRERSESLRDASGFSSPYRADEESAPRGVDGLRRPGRLATDVETCSNTTGVTGLFNHIDARVLPLKHFSMGIGTHPTVTGTGTVKNTGDIRSLRFSVGIMEGLEMGMALLDRELNTAQGTLSSNSRVINLKYSLSKLSGPMNYAVGYQRINVNDSTSGAVNSVYLSTDYRLETANISHLLSANLMFSDTSGDTMTRLNFGLESKVLTWKRPFYMIFEAEQDGDNEFNVLNLGLRYKKNPVFDLYLSHDMGHESTSLGTGMSMRF